MIKPDQIGGMGSVIITDADRADPENPIAEVIESVYQAFVETLAPALFDRINAVHFIEELHARNYIVLPVPPNTKPQDIYDRMKEA